MVSDRKVPACATSFGILGRGDFGLFVHERIEEHLPDATVRSYDPHKPSKHTEDEVADCDVVILAVPPLQMERAVRSIAPRMRQGALLVDVCSVKMHTADIMRKHVPDKVYYLLIHPLFGRQGFADNGESLEGLDLVYCGGTLPLALASTIVSTFTNLGLRVGSMTPEEHDRGPSIEQLATMYQGLVMRKAGLELNSFNLHTRSALHYFRGMDLVKNDE